MKLTLFMLDSSISCKLKFSKGQVHYWLNETMLALLQDTGVPRKSLWCRVKLCPVFSHVNKVKLSSDTRIFQELNPGRRVEGYMRQQWNIFVATLYTSKTMFFVFLTGCRGDIIQYSNSRILRSRGGIL